MPEGLEIEYYRRLADAPDETRIIVLVDGLSAFRAAYEMGGRARWLDLLTSLAADGRPVGVHFVISVDQRTGMPSTLASAVQSRVVLRMSHADDYGFLGVRGDVLSLTSPPGRGLHNNAEIQCAVLGGSGEVMAQSHAVAAFGEAIHTFSLGQHIGSLIGRSRKKSTADDAVCATPRTSYGSFIGPSQKLTSTAIA